MLSERTAKDAALYWGNLLSPDIEDFKKNRFESSLMHLIVTYCDQIEFGGVGCDYYPDYFLCLALKDAGIEAQGAFPFKTHMIFRDNTIYIKEGYRAPFMRLDRLCERRS